MLNALAVYGYRSIRDLIMLTKSFSETAMAVEPDDVPAWHWPAR
jgi:hypothetical protein